MFHVCFKEASEELSQLFFRQWVNPLQVLFIVSYSLCTKYAYYWINIEMQ